MDWPRLKRTRCFVPEEFDELGRLSRTCNGDIAVNKCEGACTSQVQPSVITPTGFLKVGCLCLSFVLLAFCLIVPRVSQECYCCRESFLRERVVALTHCYDPDGARLTAEGRSSMEVKLREPADCRCFKCGDYSR